VALRIAEKAALSDVGRARQSNEDSYLERSPLFVVADGMGGARAGEVASAIAVETAKAADVGASPEQDLAEVARSANREIYSKAQSDAEHAGMGTTFTGALVTGRDVAIGHVGDSRMYRYRDGELERLTHDHSLVEEFVRQGKLTPEEAEVHPQRSIITRALGPEPEVQVDTFTYPGRDGDVYLMCSDGLTGMISEDQAAEILAAGGSLDDAAQALIDAANEGGGRDNITVVLFRLEGDPDDADDPDTLGGQETQPGLSSETVRAAVIDADSAGGGGAAVTREREQPDDDERAPAEPELPPEEERTIAERPSQAREGREHTRIRGTVEAETLGGGVPSSSPLHARRAPPVSRRRRIVALLGVLLVLVAAVAIVWVVNRQFWFVGTDDAGQVALYRGLPYELPLGIDMYSEQRRTDVPAAAIADPRQRKYVLDHHARGRNDSEDLLKQIESNFSRP
jgi:protein phosphatase